MCSDVKFVGIVSECTKELISYTSGGFAPDATVDNGVIERFFGHQVTELLELRRGAAIGVVWIHSSNTELRLRRSIP